MRKLLLCLLAVLLVVGMVGCGKTENTPESSGPDGFVLFKEKLDAMQYIYTTVSLPTENTEAIRGEQYSFDFGSVSIYQFEAGAAALENEQIVIDGKVIPLLIQGNYGAVIAVAKDASAFVTMFEFVF